jgi:hypothetical protein
VKKILFVLLLLISTACSAPSSEPAAPTLVATVSEPLQDDTPLAAATTASPTPIAAATSAPTLPAATSTSTLPAATSVPILPAATSAPTLPTDDTSEDPPEESGKPVIIFHQEGGFAGVDLTWSIYGNGLIVTPDGEEISVAPAVVDELLEIIEQTGFFEFVQPKPSNICCDFFTFTLAVTNGDLNNVITYNGGDTNIPAGIAEAVSAVQQVITQ